MRGGTPKVFAAAAWLAAIAVGPSLAAQTDEAVTDDGSATGDADRVVWTAAALETLLARRDYPSFLLISTMGRMSSLDEASALDVDRLVRAASLPSLNALRDDAGGDDPEAAGDPELNACRSERSVAQGTLCSMERLASLAPPPLARQLTEEGARLVSLSLPAPGMGSMGSTGGRDALGLRQGLGAMSFDPLQTFGEHALENVWQRAHTPAAAASGGPGLDDVLTRLVGISPHTSGADVLGLSPGLRSVIGVDFSSTGPAAFLGLGAAQDRFRSLLGSLTAPVVGAASSSFDTPADGSESSASAPLDTRSIDLEWATGRSLVYLAAQSARLSGADAGTAERMRVVGGVAADLRREMTSFPSALATMGRDLAVATLSGNVLALASRVTSFFRGSPGALGPEAARDVRALRDGMESMRSELRSGMGEIDRDLDELITDVEVRFSRLEGLVETTGRNVQADLGALHEEVLALGERLDRMDASIRSYVHAGFDREHARTLVRCLEHRQRYLPPWNEMSFDVFSECLADLRSRAVADARDALLVDQSTPVDDLSLISVLADSSLPNLAHRLPLLARVAAERFGYPGLAVDARLANAVEWAVASEAYVTLLHDWPHHAVAVSPEDLEAMRAVGWDLRRALHAVSVNAATGGPSPLLDRVAAYYEQRLEEVEREADSLARRHRQQGLRRVPPESLLTRIESADGSGPALDVPKHVEGLLPAALRTTAVLALDDVALVYSLRSESTVSRANFRRRFLFFGRRHDRFTHTRVTIEVELHVGSRGTVARFRAAGPYSLVRTDEMNGNETSETVASTEVHIAAPFAHFLAFDWPGLANDPDAWEIEPLQQDMLDDLESRIDRELRRYATVGLDNVFAAVCSEDPRAIRLSSADRVSAQRVRDALNGLSAARTLLEAYLRLATVGVDASSADPLSATSVLLDRRSLCSGIDQGASPLRTVWLDEDHQRRLDVVRTRLAEAVGQKELAAQAPTLVDATLDRLDAALRVQLVRASVATSP